MKYVRVFSIVVLFFYASQLKAQDKAFQNPDKPAKCKNIKDGKFLRSNYPEGIWYMTVKDNIQTEYYNNGKDFIKSSLVFIDDCNYKAITLEKSDQSHPIQIGDVTHNKIVETEQNFLKIQSKIEKEQFELILIKVK